MIDPSGFNSVGELLATIDILGQLAARVVTVALNPVTIETAKAWAIILAATAGTFSYLVKEEVRQNGETRFRVLPDEDPEYTPPGRNPSPYADQN